MVHPVIFYVPHLNKTKVKATNRKKKQNKNIQINLSSVNLSNFYRVQKKKWNHP